MSIKGTSHHMGVRIPSYENYIRWKDVWAEAQDSNTGWLHSRRCHQMDAVTERLANQTKALAGWGRTRTFACYIEWFWLVLEVF